MTQAIETDVDFPRRLAFLFRPARYKVVHGGRGGGKSWQVARALLILGMDRRHRILCTREYQISIRDSVHKLLSDQISILGYGDFYDVGQAKIVGANGTEFIFAGVKNNIDSIRSMEGVTICWVEEAHSVSTTSWDVLIPTIRGEDSEIWVTFNPHQKTDPTYKRFIAAPPPDAVVVETNWYHNDWFPETLRREKDYLYSVDPEAAEHVWGGKTLELTDAQVLHGKVVVEAFEPEPGWLGPYQGVDFGFAEDPAVLVRLWIRELPSNNGGPAMRDLYVEREAYGVGVEIVNLPGLFDGVPGASKYVTRADSARPDTISHCRHHGYPMMVAAEKGPGSVEDGVEHLRSFRRIVIHPRCQHAIDESRLWSYKQDKLTGDVLPDLIDKHNHCWDAARYALEPVMKQRKLSYEYQAVKRRATAHRRRGHGFRSRSGGVL